MANKKSIMFCSVNKTVYVNLTNIKHRDINS